MTVYKIAMQHIEAKISEIREMDKEIREEHCSEENTDFLTHMIRNGKMSLEEISINATDLLGAGVDTVGYTKMAFSAFLVSIIMSCSDQHRPH